MNKKKLFGIILMMPTMLGCICLVILTSIKIMNLLIQFPLEIIISKTLPIFVVLIIFIMFICGVDLYAK